MPLIARGVTASVLVAACCCAFVVMECSAMSASKLSVFTTWNDDASTIVIGGGARLVLLFDNFGPAPSIKSAHANVTIIGRSYDNNVGPSGDPKSAAEAWFNAKKSTIQNSPGVDFWEGLNEPSCGPGIVAGSGGLTQMQWMSAFEIQRMALLDTIGAKAALFTLGVGFPDVTNAALITQMFPAIKAGIAHGAILSLHEYSSPTMMSGFSGSVATGSGWYTGRYRKLYDQFLKPNNLTIPLAITENGIDATGLCTTCSGYKTVCSTWASQGHSDCDAYYLSQLEWYDSVMRADEYVIGSTVFSLGLGGGWANYDVASLTPAFSAYLKSQQ